MESGFDAGLVWAQACVSSVAVALGDGTCRRAILPIFFDLKELLALPEGADRAAVASDSEI